MSANSLHAVSFCEDPRLCQVSALLKYCNTNFQGTFFGILGYPLMEN